jgi:hypothetical protein
MNAAAVFGANNARDSAIVSSPDLLGCVLDARATTRLKSHLVSAALAIEYLSAAPMPSRDGD